jgi:hypothetical protein
VFQDAAVTKKEIQKSEVNVYLKIADPCKPSLWYNQGQHGIPEREIRK